MHLLHSCFDLSDVIGPIVGSQRASSNKKMSKRTTYFPAIGHRSPAYLMVPKAVAELYTL